MAWKQLMVSTVYPVMDWKLKMFLGWCKEVENGQEGVYLTWKFDRNLW